MERVPLLILTDPDGNELKSLLDAEWDFDLGTTNDFTISLPRSADLTGLQEDCRVFAPGTEFGGIIKRRGTSTEEGRVSYGGFCWRGMLNNKIIQPAAGADYATDSGDVNAIIKQRVEAAFPGLMTGVASPAGVTVNWQYDRYCTLLDGLVKMLKSVGQKLHIEYVQQEHGLPGLVSVSSSPIIDYSNDVEFSEDSRINFTAEIVNDGVNHLICRGKGELRDQEIIHLYVQPDGSISRNQYYTGADEIAATYDSFGAESDDLLQGGTERLEDLRNFANFNIDLQSLGQEVEIGDIVGGRDYLTNIYLAKPIAGKIWRWTDAKETKEYEVEGE